jgi:hypothetical protein
MKKKIGDILYYFSFSLLFIQVVPWLIREKIAFLSTNGLVIITLLCVSGAFVIYAIGSLLTGTHGMQGRVVEKTKQPGLFWFFIVFDFFMGFATFIASFFYAE